MSMWWMSAPTYDQVRKNEYTNGPAPWNQFRPAVGDICVLKDEQGRTLMVETWEGKVLPIPASHTRATDGFTSAR